MFMLKNLLLETLMLLLQLASEFLHFIFSSVQHLTQFVALFYEEKITCNLWTEQCGFIQLDRWKSRKSLKTRSSDTFVA